MPMSTRELYLVLRARDEATRTLRGVSRELLATGAAAARATSRAAAVQAGAAAREQAQFQRLIALRQAQMAAAARGVQARIHEQAVMSRGIALNQRDLAAQARRAVQVERDLAAGQRVLQQRAQLRAATLRERLALMRLNGATGEQIEALQRQIIEVDRDARGFRTLARRHDEAARSGMALVRQHQEAARQASLLASRHEEAARRAGNMAAQHQAAARQARVLAAQHTEQARAAVRAYQDEAQAAEDNARRRRHAMSIIEQGGTALATAGVGLVAFGAVTAFALKNMVDVAVEYERQVRHTATQVDGFKGNLQELADIGRSVARDIALPFETIQPALFDIFSSTEANAKQAEMLLRAFAKAAVAGQVDVQEASRATIGVLNAFGRPLEDVNKVLDMQFQLVQEGVGTYQEWAEKIGLVSPSAARAGQSIEIMMAALATATRMGMSAARSSTSVARAFDAISNPKVTKNLKAMGISALDASGHMRPFNDILRDLRTAILKLPEKDRVGRILDIFKGAGSTIEARRFLQTMLLVPGTLETFDSILGEVENSTGSLDNAYGLMADTAAAKTVMLHNKWMLLKEGMGRSLIPTFVMLMDWLMKLLNVFDRLSPNGQKAVAMFLVFASALSIVGGVVLVVLGALAAIVTAFAAAGSVLLVVVGAVAAVIAILGVLAGVFVLLWKKSDNFRLIIKDIWEDFQTFWGIVSGFAQQFAAAFNEHIMPPLLELWSYIEEWVLPAFITFRDELQGETLSALKDAGETIMGVLGPAMEWVGGLIEDTLLPAIEKLIEKWNENREKIQPFIDAMVMAGKIMLIVIAVIGILVGAGVLGLLITVLSFVIDVVSAVIGIIGWLIDRFRDTIGVIKQVANIFLVLVVATRNSIDTVGSIIRGLPQTIRNALPSMDSLLHGAGQAIIQGLINGINAMIPGLGTVLKGVGSFIQDHKGPLDYDRRMLIPAGQAIMGGLMRGIEDQFPALLNQLQGINSTLDLNTGLNADGTSMFSRPNLQPAPPQVVNKYYNIEQHIVTQEISPQRVATQLGWEVTTVM